MSIENPVERKLEKEQGMAVENIRNIKGLLDRLEESIQSGKLEDEECGDLRHRLLGDFLDQLDSRVPRYEKR